MNDANESPVRTEHIAMAATGCYPCYGTGLKTPDSSQAQALCYCVYRRIFRAVLHKVREIATGAHLLPQISLRETSRPTGRTNTGHMRENYSADVFLAAKRALNPSDWRIFRYHYLLGADAGLCARKLGMDRNTFALRRTELNNALAGRSSI